MSAKPSIPNTPLARRRHIVELLSKDAVKSQGQLEKLLRADGLEVTQATLSRDLDELGAVKIRSDEGALIYAVPEGATGVNGGPGPSDVLPESRLARLCEELLISATPSANLVLVRTPPGAAQFFASALDQAHLDTLIGTIAGDDTVLVITAMPNGGDDVATYLARLAEGSSRQTAVD